MNEEFDPLHDDMTSMSKAEIEQHLTKQHDALMRFSGSTGPQEYQKAQLEHFHSNIEHLSALGLLPRQFQKYLN